MSREMSSVFIVLSCILKLLKTIVRQLFEPFVKVIFNVSLL